MILPEGIRILLGDEGYRTDGIGMSQASVLLFPDKVLKCQPHTEQSENEAKMLRFLRGKISVPEVYAYESLEGIDYLLMERSKGEMACADGYLDDPETLAGLLANTLHALWAVDVSGCPSDQSLACKLAQARYRVEHGLVDTDNVEPTTFGKDGFRNPAHLLEWLETHQPTEDLVLSHGDLSLPNVFGEGQRLTGLIDLDRAGVADRWCDIAICCRSLTSNLNGRYGGKPRPGFDPKRLFEALGLEPDEEKLRYYILLDELF